MAERRQPNGGRRLMIIFGRATGSVGGKVNPQQLEAEVRGLVRRAYPQIDVRIEPWSDDPGRLAVYFTEAQFASLYPAQRYHYLRHLIPDDFYERHLADSEWFELAPGERPEDLVYPDSELIADITPDVMPWPRAVTAIARSCITRER